MNQGKFYTIYYETQNCSATKPMLFLITIEEAWKGQNKKIKQYARI